MPRPHPPTLYFSKDANDNCVCPICIDTLQPKQILTHTTCGHVYHSQCIMGWLKCHYAEHPSETFKCPVCTKTANVLYSIKGTQLLSPWHDVALNLMFITIIFVGGLVCGIMGTLLWLFGCDVARV